MSWKWRKERVKDVSVLRDLAPPAPAMERCGAGDSLWMQLRASLVSYFFRACLGSFKIS